MELEIIYQILTYLSLLLAVPFLGFTGAGSGTEGDRWEITTLAEWNEIPDDETGHYILMNDIDVAGGTIYNIRSGLTGSIDMNGKSILNISGFTNEFGTASNTFILVTTGGHIFDGEFNFSMNVDYSSITPFDTKQDGIIERIEVTGSITNTGSVYLGKASETSVQRDIKSSVVIDAGGDASGWISTVTINCTIDNIIVVGSITAVGTAYGLSASEFNNGAIDNCFWDTEATGVATSNGGTGKTTDELKKVATFTDVAATAGLDAAWDFVGNPNDDVASNDYWDINANEYPHLTALVDAPVQPISGTINDEASNPVENAIVMIYTEGSLEDQTAPTFVESVLTDANGDWFMTTAYDETLSYKVEYKKFIPSYTGTIDSATASSFTDTGAFTAGEFDDGQAIVRLTGALATERRITGNADTDTCAIDGTWGTTPSVGESYEVGYMYSDELKFKPPKS